MKIILLVNLLLHLPVYPQSYDEGISFTSHSVWVQCSNIQGFLKRLHGSPSSFHLFVDGVLKVTRQRFDLFDLLLEITPEAGQLIDDAVLNLLGPILLGISLGVKVAQDLGGFRKASFADKGWWSGYGLKHVVDLDQTFRTLFVGVLDLTEIGDEVSEDLAPGLLADEMVSLWPGVWVPCSKGSYGLMARDILPSNLSAKTAVGVPLVGTGV